MNPSGGAASSIKAGGIMSVSGALVMLQGPSLEVKLLNPRSNPSTRSQSLVTLLEADPFNLTQELNPSSVILEAQGKYVLSRDSTVTSTVDRVVTHEPFVGHGTKITHRP